MKPVITIIMLTVLCAASTHADETRVNPFVRPFLPQSTEPGNPTGSTLALQLKALMPAGDQGLANIDGQILRIGDQIEGYELIAVTAERARLRQGSEVVELELRQSQLSIAEGSP